MAVRIYSLAKDLNVDSKELVDICTQIGIRGKGSALASLSDDEVAKLKDHFSKPSGGSAPRNEPGAPLAPERPRERARVGKMPVLSAPKPATPPRAEPSEEPEEPAPAAEAESPEVAETPAEADDGPRSPGPLAGVMRRDDYIGPGGAMGRPPVLSEPKPTSRPAKPSGSGPRARPAIKLAPLPSVEPPTPAARSNEPPAQKPDMKLPADALRASKAGSKPLAAHLRRHEDALDKAKQEREAEAKDASRGKKGKGTVKAKEDGTPMLGGREQRQLNRRRTGGRSGEDESGSSRPSRRLSRTRRSGVSTAAPRKDRVTLELPCTVRDLSEAAGVPAAQILRLLMQEGVMTTITAQIDPELTEFIVAELGANVDFVEAKSLEDEMLDAIREQVDADSDLLPRPPVITFLGHVDHGKTSLLDRIIGINVVSGESGGITQHIRAYQIDKGGRKISFVDTPGHEAFTEMRARGANVTDIAVLVVAADDGIMPQTEEAISHARAAEVPIVVALNKCDLPGADFDRIYQQLAAADLLPSEWGGETEVVKTSALKGDGIDDLLETLLTVAELHEYEANPNRAAIGTCLEAQLDADRGVMAKCIVGNGTLRVGDVVVCGDSYGRVKALYDTLDGRTRHESAGPSMPVTISGFDVAPIAGEHFYVIDDIAQARQIAEDRAHALRSRALGSGPEHVTLENLFERLEGAAEVQTLNVILRADVRGSIEAIQKELGKLEHPEVKIRILQATVGGISEADVTLADASDAIIIGFNVVPDEKARSLADNRGVQIRRYEIIYKITEDLKAALEGMLRPEQREVDLGRALVQQLFKISRVGTVAGCRVLAGTVERNARARVIRDNTVVGDYPIDTLRREKDDTKEVREGLECGIKLSGFNDLKEADILEVYRMEEVGRKFDD
ncbi:MAG: translation initiation factor IF-2 [Pirellulales bacterium]|nr:translation initiation factor IF-2 [Pirellulales bacterium]